MRNAFGFSLTFILCIILSATAATQNTINVPADQPTIQAAINAASTGDTVLVAPGTYAENLNFNGKAITVTSSGGPAVTIVDGGGVAPVVIFNTGESTNSVLNGFTLRNGVPSRTFPNIGTGAGVWVFYTSPTITNNVITNNHAICGIGMEIDGGSAVIRGNTITGNTQAGGSGGCGGGGIEITGDSTHPVATPLITGNTITNNILLGAFGGGIEVSYFASPTIQNNYIAGNSASNFGGGINLDSYGSPVAVQNIIVNNSVVGEGSGGGIYVSALSSPGAVVANNTIVGNLAADGSSGIFTSRFTTSTISNNIVVASSGQNGIVCDPLGSTYPSFSHNDVVALGSGGQAWSSNCASFAQSNGNFSADPQFVNAAGGDYHLQPGSAAVDAGDNSAPNLLQQDYDGKTRMVDGNNDCIDTVDLGAYELQAVQVASFSPASLLFTTQRLDTTSGAQTVTLSSTGTSCVKMAGLSVISDFGQSNNCGTGVPAGTVCTVNVTFTPTARGSRTGALILNSVLGTAPSVSLMGTGVASLAGLTPTSLSFASQGVGTTGAPQTITLANSGDATLNITSVTVSGDFQQSNNCGTVVASNSSCTITITFTPTIGGTRGGTLTVVDDSFGGNRQTVALLGTGTVSTTGLTIDGQVSADQGTAKSTVSTVPFSTVAGNELLLAFIATDYTSGTNTIVKSVTGGGLTWVLVVRSNKQSGTSEIWRAFAPSPLSNVNVTATLSHSVVSSMTVVSFAGASSSGSSGSGAIGVTKSTSAASGAPTATLVTTQNNSWVFGVGNDFDNAIGRTPGGGQVLVHQNLSPTGDTYWVQRQTAPTLLSGTNVTINDTAPTGDRYNLAICEILPAQ